MLAGLLLKVHTRRLQDALRHEDAKQLLSAIRKGADLEQPFALTAGSDPHPPLLQALYLANPACLELLLQAGALLPEATPQGTPLLELAISARRQSLKLLTLLLQAGLKPDLSDGLRQTAQATPLFACLALDENEVMLHINRLIQYGADINLPDAQGHTLLRHALLLGQQALVVALVGSGAELPQDLDRLGCADDLKALARRCYEDLKIRQRLHPF